MVRPRGRRREVQKPMEGTDAASQFSWTRARVQRSGVGHSEGETSETAAMTPIVELIAARKRYGNEVFRRDDVGRQRERR